MAIDEILFQICHRERCGFLRLYSWAKPSFSYGVSQKNTRAINRKFIETHGCESVRRITGGKTVLHHDELTYALVSSEDLFYRDHDLYQSYLLISQVLVKALLRVGVNACLSSGSTPEMSRSDHPCFSFPTPHEIEVNGKKIIGSAQKRDNTALLQHGSIPFTMDYDMYAQGANSRPDMIRSAMTTLNETSRTTREELSQALVQSFQEFSGATLQPFDTELTKYRQELQTLQAKYASEEWNFSR